MYAFMPAPRSSRLAASLLLATVPLAAGHAYLSLPQSRNFVKNDKNGYMPQSGNGAGICGDGGQWPADSDFVNYLGGPQTTYVAGSTVVFEVTITAHHKGHFEFRVCDQEITSALADADACLDKWVLERVDPEITYGPNDCLPNDERGDCQPLDTSHPERFYLPPPAAGVGQNWSESVAGVQVERMHYTIPKNLTCTKCTLQWQWWTANSCIPKPGYGCYFASMGVQGWNAHQWCGSYCGECPGSDGVPGCGEEFRNCADLTILPVGSPVPVPTPPPTPAPRDCGTAVGGPCAACLATNNVCYDQSQAWCSQMRYQWCGAGADSTPAPAAPSPAPAPATPAPTPSPAAPTPAPPPATPAPTPAPVPLPGPLDCGAAHGGPCAACLATNYVCYDESEDWCDWMRYQWCGGGAAPNPAPPTPAPTPAPAPATPAPTPAPAAPTPAPPPATPAPTPAPVPLPGPLDCSAAHGGPCAACLATNYVCYDESEDWCDWMRYQWCGVGGTPAPPTPAPGARPPECGSCAQCLANNGVCYANAKSWCDLYPQYTWCGAALVQAQVQPHSHGLPARRLRGRPRRSRKHGAGADEEDESAMLQQETYFEESEDGEEDEEL